MEEDPSTRPKSALFVRDFAHMLHDRVNPPSQAPTNSPEPSRKRQRLSYPLLHSVPASTSISTDTNLSVSSDPVTAYHPQDWVAQVLINGTRCLEDLTAIAGEFKEELLELKFKVNRNNRPEDAQINSEVAQQLVKFFFDDVFGSGCRDRIYTLVDELIIEYSSTEPLTSGVLAAHRATDEELLPDFRAFFLTYSKWHRGEVEHSNVYSMILQTIRSYDLYNSFAHLLATAAGSAGGELRDFLASEGYRQSPGVDIRTCILQYLCRELDMAPKRLSNTLQAQRGIHCMVLQFGRGILILLPKGASYRYSPFHLLLPCTNPCLLTRGSNRITLWGIQKFRKILPLLHKKLPETTQLCEAAERSILQPLINDQLNLLLLSPKTALRPNLTLLDAVASIEAAEITEEGSIDGDLPSPLTDSSVLALRTKPFTQRSV